MKEFLQSMLGCNQLPEKLLTCIFQESEGNPLYAEEVVRSLVDTNKLFRDDGSWRFNKAEVRNIKIPKKIKIRIDNRLKSHDKPTMNVLRAAAIIGREFNFDLLMPVTGMEETEGKQSG